MVRKVGGLRVAVIGIETEQLGSLTTPKLLGPWRVMPIAATVRRYAEEARRKADFVVLLAHITTAEEEQLLAGAPEVPVIVSGHTHYGIPAAMERDGRVLVRAKAYTEELGRLDLQVDTKTKRVASWKWRAIPVNGRAVKPAPDVARRVEHWEGEVSKAVDVPVAESRRDFTKAEVRALIEAAMREQLKADFAFMNFGGVRDVFPRGRILARHVWNIMPFDNKVVVGRFKGSRLPEAATRGAVVDPEREYTLATSDFSAANQGAARELRSKGLVFSHRWAAAARRAAGVGEGEEGAGVRATRRRGDTATRRLPVLHWRAISHNLSVRVGFVHATFLRKCFSYTIAICRDSLVPGVSRHVDGTGCRSLGRADRGRFDHGEERRDQRR